MDLNVFETDANKSNDGVWCPVDTETEVKIARYGNKNFQRSLQREMAPYKRIINTGAMKDDVADKIMCTALAEGILVDWRGMKYGGEDLPYSIEAAVEILMNPKLRDFRQLVVELSQEMELFREEEVAESEGKSQAGSSGSQTGETENSS